ncbi:hypothetical protein OsJ_21606 [Oryza sativa Japonica Group]|uniref:Uncharacterized protein n=1 Tax=Oryza sativa subsp. japonica TaxID=39947 RepID=Q5Z701_ORYSJ|nr:hypothetical protein OsJ_21606 [Oryza sativa Japonica Group]BAD54268.1 hypothetical protein [Oryza sativa Japonica Group]
MAKSDDGDTGGGESGRLGGCADLKLGNPPPTLAPPLENPHGDRASPLAPAASMSPPPPDSSSIEWRRREHEPVVQPPVDDAMASVPQLNQRASELASESEDQDKRRRGE